MINSVSNTIPDGRLSKFYAYDVFGNTRNGTGFRAVPEAADKTEWDGSYSVFAGGDPIRNAVTVSVLKQASGMISKNPNKRLSIFYVNDMHGNTDNMAGLYVASKAFDRKVEVDGSPSLKLSAGDNYSGGDPSKNDLIMSLLKQMGIKYSAVGNHEFDALQDGFVRSIKKGGVGFVSSNLTTNANEELSSLIKDVVIEVVDGEKYGIVGLTTDELKTCASSPEAIEGVVVQEGDKKIEAVQKKVDELKSQGVNKVILLSHCGLEEDKKMAKNLSGVDIIVGGHSHDVVQGATDNGNLVYDKEGHPVIIVQTGENGLNYGVLDVEFDAAGVLKKIDNKVFKTLDLNSPIIEFLKDSAMGKSPVVGSIMEIDPFPGNKRIEPCAWSNLICDALKEQMNVQIAYMNAANIRKTPKPGHLTERAILETTPFKNTVLTTTMTEKEVVDTIKFGLQSLTREDGYPGIVQVSGLKYKADKNGNLLSLSFVDKDGKETPIDVQNPSATKSYSVTYDSFMADGREYPVCDVKNRQVQNSDLTKDMLVRDYILKMPTEQRENLVIKDDHRVQIV